MYRYVTLKIYEPYVYLKKATPYTLYNLWNHFDRIKKGYEVKEKNGRKYAKVRVREDVAPYIKILLESDNFHVVTKTK